MMRNKSNYNVKMFANDLEFFKIILNIGFYENNEDYKFGYQDF